MVGLLGVDAAKIIKGAGDLLRGDQSLPARRSALEAELRKLDYSILIILDDLDRLQPDELLLIFKLVRLVARLPNVYYLLTYDERTLLDVLMRTDLARDSEERARDYVEKIVQVRLDLPTMHENQQSTLVDAALQEVLAQNRVTLTSDDIYRLASAYQSCLRAYLSEPRAINRFFAQVDALYPLVRDEVDFIDFLLLTFLRTFESGVYSLVHERKEELTNASGLTSLGVSRETLTDRKARWLDLLRASAASEDSANQLLSLLATLFLPLRGAVENSNYGSEWLAEYHKMKRVGSARYFDRYFHFGVPANDISDMTLRAGLRQIEDDTSGPERDEIVNRVGSEPMLVLSKVLQFDEVEPIGKPLGILKLLAAIFDSLPEGDLLGRPQTYVGWVVRRLLDRIPSTEVDGVLDEMIQVGGLQVLAILAAPRSDSKDEDSPAWQSEARKKVMGAAKELMEEIEGRSVDQVTDAQLVVICGLPYIRDQIDVREWLWNQLSTGRWPAVAWLGRLVTEGTSYGGGRTRRIAADFDTSYVDQLVGVDRLIDLLGDQLDAEEVTQLMGRSGFGLYDPTERDKELYALAALRRLRDQRAKETALISDATELEQHAEPD